MIDNTIMDRLLPMPTDDALAAQLQAELETDGFAVTRFRPGGVFYTLLRIVIRLYLQIVQLLRTQLPNSYATHADGEWLDLKAADYGKLRKQPVKTQGKITISRTLAGEAIRIYRGHVFKTAKDINGEELRYFSTADAILPRGVLAVDVPVEAEIAGTRYNVPTGQICRSLTYIDGIDTITNADGWMTREGCDAEDTDSLRRRVLRAWAELSAQPTRDKLINICESVPGVLFARVDDNHPRGQGTVDVIVTGTAGAATALLLQQVTAAASAILGPADDLQVRSSVTVAQEIALTVTVSAADAAADADIITQVTAVITRLLQISRGRELNTLTRADIIFAAKGCSSSIRNVIIAAPAADVALDADKVLILGNITITVRREVI